MGEQEPRSFPRTNGLGHQHGQPRHRQGQGGLGTGTGETIARSLTGLTNLYPVAGSIAAA